MPKGAFTPATRKLILTRDNGQCQRCGDDGTEFELQHRRARGMGGSSRKDTASPANGIALCTRCHRHVESEPRWSLQHGFRVPQSRDPLLVPVDTYHEGWVLFDDRGGAKPAAEDVVEMWLDETTWRQLA